MHYSVNLILSSNLCFSSRSNHKKPYQKYWQNKIENRHWAKGLSGFEGFKSRNRKEEDWFQVQNQGNTNPKYYSWQHKYWVFPGSIFYGLGYCITNLNFFSANSSPMHSSTALWCIFSRGIQLYFTSNPRNPRTWMFVHISVPEIIMHCAKSKINVHIWISGLQLFSNAMPDCLQSPIIRCVTEDWWAYENQILLTVLWVHLHT